MRIIDRKFEHHVARYILQCALATLVILIILVFLDVLTYPAIVAALGSSSFIVFTMPETAASKPRVLIGGYLVGIAVGSLCSFLSHSPVLMGWFGLQQALYVGMGGLSVGLAIFLMVLTNTEHAPAASVALGLVLHQWDYLTVIYVVSGVVLMSLLKELLRPKLKNLL